MNNLLPGELPCWYAIEKDEEKGWSPQTTDIEESIVKNAWNGKIKNSVPRNNSISLDDLYLLSPLQIGGGSLPEGDNLPAQIAGVPCIPGSSLRGSFLSWIAKLCQEYQSSPEESTLSKDEHEFWQKYLDMSENKIPGWQPKSIRFETTWVENLQPFPFNSQQDWQVFGDKDSRKLGVIWQVKRAYFDSQEKSTSRKKLVKPIVISVNFIDRLQDHEQSWVENQLRKMLLNQGLGKGIASGFGKIGTKEDLSNKSKWRIELEGMKPAIQGRDKREGINGSYRWSPQVLRACLRGYFTRIALTILSKEDSKKLTEIIFGGLGRPGKLFLNSYLIDPCDEQNNNQDFSYSNISKNIVEQTWLIDVNCNDEFHNLIDNLLSLASKLGGLGPGWRRPPHKLPSKNIYRGSSFTVNSTSVTKSSKDLVQFLQEEIKVLANSNKMKSSNSKYPIKGCLVSIWQLLNWKQNPNNQVNSYNKNNVYPLWSEKIVHGICSSDKNNKERKPWCGGQNRPSGYSVREYPSYSLITVFDPKVEETLNDFGRDICNQIWSS